MITNTWPSETACLYCMYCAVCTVSERRRNTKALCAPLIINIDLQNRMPVEHVEFPESVEGKNAGD